MDKSLGNCILENMKRDHYPQKTIKAKLTFIREWAQETIQEGSQPPWAWYQYMKLVEATDAILNGMTTKEKANLQQSAERQEKPLRLVDSTSQINNAQHHCGKIPVQMPM